jgi:hypothetical protein
LCFWQAEPAPGLLIVAVGLCYLRLWLNMLDGMVALARRPQVAPGRHEALKAGLFGLYLGSLRTHGCALAETQIHELLAMDLELNAQGIEVWLDREAQAAG